jgi:hypothetical protein
MGSFKVRPILRERSGVRTNNDLVPNCDGYVPSITGFVTLNACPLNAWTEERILTL